MSARERYNTVRSLFPHLRALEIVGGLTVLRMDTLDGECLNYFVKCELSAAATLYLDRIA